jgi:uncharacterized protein (DUF849 family)
MPGQRFSLTTPEGHAAGVTTPVILELAVNGPTPRSANPRVPRSPAEIAEVALRGIERGAAIVHNHNDGLGLPPTATALEAYLELLEPAGLPWSVAVLGGDVVGCGLAELAIRRGGHVRVGLEDYAGPDVPDNIELLDAAVALVERLGRAPAGITETSAILGVPTR